MNTAKLGAIGAVGAALGVVAIYALLAWTSRSHPITGGIDRIERDVAWIAMAIPTLLIAAVQLVFAKQLWAMGSGKRYAY